MDISLTTSGSLYSLRDFFTGERTLICFNGPISKNLLGEIGVALRAHIESGKDCMNASMDVFSVYIEMSQNVRHYMANRGYSPRDSSATVVIAETEPGHFVVSAGNIVDQPDGHALLARVQELAQLDKVGLKALYKEQLRKPRGKDLLTGAGIGLIDIARKASQPLQATLDDLGDGRSFFTLRATI